ncbi:Pimeloyl-ACP methyl ester carboxylesterase [Klenkia soli]|uniref:Pimeloyl-ACP methyl ester carboxylesterase n=1 Tax=Klenkia soli TaxID=1052260 RepID=A0A1H0KA02_9ACTN|nr:Pimeloyl-ACP methyl ester carboxylesterase [Klenkia soli]
MLDPVDSFTRSGLTFDVRDAGPADGEPVVLLHGFPQHAGSWDHVVPVLHEAGLRTLAPDQRGYSPGARPTGRRAYVVRELVDDVRALLDAAGLERAHVVGHDWGAMVAWALAAWHPDRVTSLTAVSVPHPAAFTTSFVTSSQGVKSAYMAFFQLPVVPEKLLTRGNGAFLADLLTRAGLPRPDAQETVTRLRPAGALTAALNWYRALPLGAKDAVGRVAVRTLHVWSDRDGFLGRAGTEATAPYVTGDYRLEVLPGITHWVPETAGARLGELVAEHVRG